MHAPAQFQFYDNAELGHMNRAPKWMKQMCEHLMENNLCIIGDGSVKDQWGAMAWTFATKSSFQEICQFSQPVDGDPKNMKELRAEATFLLSAISIVHVLQPLLQNKQIKINIHTSCRGLINRVLSTNINSPSNVLADHIDIIYQIRQLLKNLKNIKVTFINTVAPKEDDLDKAARLEQLLYKCINPPSHITTTKTVQY